MEICLGMIGWKPKDFWTSSLTEVYAAIKGFTEFNGGNQQKPMTSKELDNLMELYPD